MSNETEKDGKDAGIAGERKNEEERLGDDMGKREREKEGKTERRKAGMSSSLTLREIAVACCHCPAR